MSEAPARLIAMPISHYCEKARWALDRAGVHYREERHVQIVHAFAARRAGGARTVPVLVSGDEVVSESADIVAWADERTPQELRTLPSEPAARAEVENLCRRFDDVLGPSGRRLIYAHMFDQRELALKYNDTGVPNWEDRLARGTWPLMQRIVARVLGVVPGGRDRDEATVFAELDHVAGLLADGRPYLCGERFSAADLTFAALSAPVTAPPEYGTPLPQPAELDASTARLVERARAHPAGRHALAMFARHRSERAGAAAPVP